MTREQYTTFNQKEVDHLQEPMFFGANVNVARYDKVRLPWIDKHTEKQLGFFWRPEEINLSEDASQYAECPDNEQHIFMSNLKYQILLDSVQGRSPNIAFLPLVSLPELETWIETWSWSETVHSRSYTHIIRNIVPDPTDIFDNIINNTEIMERATSVTKYYDNLIELANKYSLGQPVNQDELDDALFLCMVAVNVLEGIRFYVSFACSFAFAERKIMEGNAKVISFIARDESLHLSVTQRILQAFMSGSEGERMQQCATRNLDTMVAIFTDAAEQEKKWAEYLFKDGSMIGLNTVILHQYIEYITDVRIKAIGMPAIYNQPTNPLPWMNNWLVRDNIQVAPQETEISSYITGGLDSTLKVDEFNELTL